MSSESVATKESHVSSMNQAMIMLRETKDELSTFVDVVRRGELPVCEDAVCESPHLPLADLLDAGPGIIRNYCDDMKALMRELRDILL